MPPPQLYVNGLFNPATDREILPLLAPKQETSVDDPLTLIFEMLVAREADAVQENASVAVTLYVPLVETFMEDVAFPLLQEKEIGLTPPVLEAVNWTEPPLQTKPLGEAVIEVDKLLTEIVLDKILTQLPAVIVTVYVVVEVGDAIGLAILELFNPVEGDHA